MLRKKLLRWLTLGALGLALIGGPLGFAHLGSPAVHQVADPGNPTGNGG
jgi:hypothetical protein